MSTRIENLVPPELASLILSESSGRRVWLVGGAIRDFFLEQKNPDLDFAVEHGASLAARKVADRLGAAYFVLDSDRDAARILAADSSTLDFARIRAETIEADLALRDFTINACAIDLADPSHLIDPLGGLQDIKEGVLRACAQESMVEDPVRALRGIRLAAGLRLQIEAETKQQIRDAGNLLAEAAAERKRDELSKLLNMNVAPTALRLARKLQLLQPVLPELAALPEGEWEGSIRTLERLIELTNVVASSYRPDGPENLRLAELSLRLGRYRQELEEYLSARLRGGHQVRQILHLAAPYSALEHGFDAVYSRARQLRYSEAEASRARAIVQSKDQIAAFKIDASDLEIHRFYRTCGDVGVDAALLHLARTMTSDVPQEQFELAVEGARRVLGAWFDAYDQIVKPPKLIRGDELADYFELQGGPVIGSLLAGIAEGQVSGSVQTRSDAFDRAQELLDGKLGETGRNTPSSDQG